MRTLAALVAVGLALTASPVMAHAVLVRSVPNARAVLSQPPGRVELWFNERLEPAWSSASVWNAAGAQVDRRDAVVSTEDGKRLSLTLSALSPGTYTVRLRVVSVDGHVVEASFPFTVQPTR